MRRLTLLISLLVLMLLSTTSIASAIVTREKPSGYSNVAKDETVDDDLLLTGDTAVIDGTVNGDVLALGESVTVNGTINGNLIAFGNRVTVKGAVNGAVITAGNTVTVDGTVQRSVAAAGSRVNLSETAKIGGSLVAAGDHVEHRGVIARGVAVAGSSLYFAGKVGKEIKAAGDRLEFAGSAEVNGPVDLWSDRQAVVTTGAKIGAISYHATESDLTTLTLPWYLQPGWIALKVGGFLALGLLLLSLFPRLRNRLPETLIANPWQAPVAGFLALIATPVAAIILMITVIGLPIGVITLVAYPVLIYVGQIFVAWSVGRLLADRVPALQNVAWPLLFLIGVVLTTLLVEIPFFGGFLSATMLAYGMGTVWLLLKNRERTA